ncbi:hypothetical protein HHI36_006027 [Cryptolaemus montrouzieri]|uniref:Uncharacterized protein n=1 Tax=Cryptolaemus montrouzieri TaxID=559131 RepID=A0ABD2NVT4_9CUCU
MDTWLKTQCKLMISRRYQTLRIPKKLKNLLSGTDDSENACTYLITEEARPVPLIKREENNNHSMHKNTNSKRDKPLPKLWRTLSLQNMRNRKEAKIEERRRPMIPPVLKTYDKGVKMGQPQQWL